MYFFHVTFNFISSLNEFSHNIINRKNFANYYA